MSFASSAVIGLCCSGLHLHSYNAIGKLTFLMTFYNHLFPFLTHFMNSLVLTSRVSHLVVSPYGSYSFQNGLGFL